MNQERFQLFRNSLLSELLGLVKRFPETREYVTAHLEAMVREFEFLLGKNHAAKGGHQD